MREDPQQTEKNRATLRRSGRLAWVGFLLPLVAAGIRAWTGGQLLQMSLPTIVGSLLLISSAALGWFLRTGNEDPGRTRNLLIVQLIIFLLGLAAFVLSVISSINLSTFNIVKPIDIVAVCNDQTKSVDDRVKIAILYVKGDNNPDISNVPSTKSMGDFGLDAQAYFDLTRYLNIIARSCYSNAAEVMPFKVKTASKIQDCIDLVKKAGTVPHP